MKRIKREVLDNARDLMANQSNDIGEMKPYFRIKGKYGDKRNRVIIEWQEDRWTIRSKSLPKPEILLKISALLYEGICLTDVKASIEDTTASSASFSDA